MHCHVPCNTVCCITACIVHALPCTMQYSMLYYIVHSTCTAMYQACPITVCTLYTYILHGAFDLKGKIHVRRNVLLQHNYNDVEELRTCMYCSFSNNSTHLSTVQYTILHSTAFHYRTVSIWYSTVYYTTIHCIPL